MQAFEYSSILAAGQLNYIAITDHEEIRNAVSLRNKIGDQIIIGEEILSLGGEIIGLYLSERIPAGLSVGETISSIKEQDGLVYIPHPFELGRHSLNKADLEQHHSGIDIVEAFNSRGWGRGKYNMAVEFARVYNIVVASSSDAHGQSGLGTAYTELAEPPTRTNLLGQLAQAHLVMEYSPLSAYLYPTINRWKKRLGLISYE